jgi:hypothetical protein
MRLNWQILAIFLPIVVATLAGTPACAQMSDDAFHAMIAGQAYAMAQPKVLEVTLSVAEQARQRAELGAHYASGTTMIAAQSAVSPMSRPAFADRVEALAATFAKPAAVPLLEAQRAALLADAAREMFRRPVQPGGAPSRMSVDAFENMKRNVERLRK